MYSRFDNSPMPTDATLSGNSAERGGGMYNERSSPVLANVILNSNLALTYGGGMVNEDSSLTLTNVTFNGNSAHWGGGG